jgi:TolB-like protein
MTIWSGEIKELERLYDSVKGTLPLLTKELEQLVKTDDANVAMLYSRRCLEVIVTDLCECELKRPRKTEPLKGIIDKLNSEEKVPSHIITSMHGLNSLSTYGAHPKDFDLEQVKPVLNNLTIVIKWYLKYKESLEVESAKGATTKSETSDISKGKKEKSSSKIQISKLAVIILIVVLAGTGGTIIYFAIKDHNKFDNLEKSIAVLPFRNDSSEDSTQYFMDGVMEELLNNLQTIKTLTVCGRTSVEQYRGQNKTIPQIARELGVNYIIEGSGQKSGKSLRMRVQLIAAYKNKEKHIWANSFEQENIDLKRYFKTQSSFAEAIAKELNTALTLEEKQLIEKMPTQSLRAYEAYLKGMVYWRRLTKIDIETSIKYFDLAIEIDSGYAPAYAGISGAWAGLVQMGFVSPVDAGPNIMGALAKAVELDSTLADVQSALAGIKTWVLWDWAGGESAFKKAISINPNHVEARAYYSHFLNMMGRPDEAKEQIDLALKLDPANPLIISLYSVDLIFFKRYEEAIRVGNEALKLDPTSPLTISSMIFASHLAGRKDETIELYKKFLSSMYNVNTEIFDLNYKKLGYEKTLEIVADSVIGNLSKTYAMPVDIAILFTFSGDNKRAIDWLEKGFEERDQSMPYLLLPIFDPLRNDPRFQEITRKMNLPLK